MSRERTAPEPWPVLTVAQIRAMEDLTDNGQRWRWLAALHGDASVFWIGEALRDYRDGLFTAGDVRAEIAVERAATAAHHAHAAQAYEEHIP